MKFEEISYGEIVSVKKQAFDQFDGDFVGTTRLPNHIDGLVFVEDKNGDCWVCDPEQLSKFVED